MFKPLSLIACLTALGLIAQSTQLTGQTGLVRVGVRRTGEAVSNGTRAVVRGSREVVGRASQATRNVARTATGAPQVQTNADIDLNQQQLNDDGQNQELNASSEQGRYESGYRGVDGQNNNYDQAQHQQPGQADYNGRVYQVRHDRNGREFICVGGCPVYLDSQHLDNQDLDSQDSNAQAREAYKLSDEQMQNDKQIQDQADQGQQYRDQQADQPRIDESTYVPNNGNGAAPAPPVPVRTDIDSAVPASPNLESVPASPSANSDPAIQSDQNPNLNDPSDSNVDEYSDSAYAKEESKDPQTNDANDKDEN